MPAKPKQAFKGNARKTVKRLIAALLSAQKMDAHRAALDLKYGTTTPMLGANDTLGIAFLEIFEACSSALDATI